MRCLPACTPSHSRSILPSARSRLAVVRTRRRRKASRPRTVRSSCGLALTHHSSSYHSRVRPRPTSQDIRSILTWLTPADTSPASLSSNWVVAAGGLFFTPHSISNPSHHPGQLLLHSVLLNILLASSLSNSLPCTRNLYYRHGHPLIAYDACHIDRPVTTPFLHLVVIVMLFFSSIQRLCMTRKIQQNLQHIIISLQ